ncbi:hypothetical protein DICVIV_12741 [Dictyocaulus viviparus]|uniref:Uncharacterized protein n=1 Tax=Dictyocaulus viviparus TaxID=29172 RepID=A0A0D8X9P6_DICVI|nr:hypothetical protein DICVIV_12741 [Dictyocaulus viviparus]
MLAQGTKAIYLESALLGVAGFEFAYDYIVNIMGEYGCGPSDDRRWCVLLDEHGYVFYSNQRDISYEDYLQFADVEDPIKKGKHISQWFGNINRVSQRAILKYTDHQATCTERKVVVMSANSVRHIRRRSTREAMDSRSRPQSTNLIDMNRSDRPCTLNSVKCSVSRRILIYGVGSARLVNASVPTESKGFLRPMKLILSRLEAVRALADEMACWTLKGGTFGTT